MLIHLILTLSVEASYLFFLYLAIFLTIWRWKGDQAALTLANFPLPSVFPKIYPSTSGQGTVWEEQFRYSSNGRDDVANPYCSASIPIG